MVDRLLSWQRTDLAIRAREDYTGLDPTRPRLYARVCLSTNFDTAKPWYWVLAETVTVSSGYEETFEKAVHAAERAYVQWRDPTSAG